MGCPRCGMQVRGGTQWCPDCGFQQLVPEIHPPLPGRVSLLATGGTPVPGAPLGPSKAGILSLMAVLVLVAGMVLIGLSPEDEEALAEQATGEPLGVLPPSDETTGVAAETPEDRKARRQARRAARKALEGSPTAEPTDLPSDEPTDLPTELPTGSATTLPTPTAAPTPGSPTASPQSPKTRRPKPPRTPTPTPTPPGQTPVSTPTMTPRPQPTATPTPTPTPRPTPTATPTPTPTPSPTPTPAPKTAEEIAAGLSVVETCRSIQRKGHGYDVAHAYWVLRTNRSWFWDVDGNGRVCENVYR